MDGKTVKECLRGCFQWKTLRNRLPCLLWIPTYNVASFVSDFVAGLTVGMMIIPQGIAMSVMAGLPVQVCVLSNSFLHSIASVLVRIFRFPPA